MFELGSMIDSYEYVFFRHPSPIMAFIQSLVLSFSPIFFPYPISFILLISSLSSIFFILPISFILPIFFISPILFIFAL